MEPIDADDLMMVSVVIASNRVSDYLPEAVASVRQQSHPVLEVLLVDDGVGEPLRERARQLEIPCISLSASGVSIARNRGASASRGELIAFLDADDVWHPHRVGLQLQVLRENPSAVAASCGGWYLDADNVSFRGTVNAPSIGALLIRREALSASGGFQPAFVHGEDNELIPRLLQLGDIVAVDRPSFGYRRHSGDVSGALLAGRTGSLPLLQLQIWGAKAHEGEALRDALREGRRRCSRKAGRATTHDFLAAVRRRRWETVRASAAWGRRCRGPRFAGDLGAAVVSWARRR